MSKINEIMGAVGRHGDDCIRDADAASESFDELREMIAAALADARREGAEAMRAKAAKLARALPLYYGSGDDGADESLAQAIDDLPLPTGERQAVLLTDEQIERAVDGHGWTVSELQVEDIPGMARDIEAAVLAANNLGVRRG